MVSQHQHLPGHLINLIESHVDRLTQKTVQSLQSSQRTPSYNKLPPHELSSEIHGIYLDLARWLDESSDSVIHAWYNDLGEKRFNEGIRLSEALWALSLTKYRLVECIDAVAPVNSSMELYRKLEFMRLVGRFFDRAAFYTAEGYDRQAALHSNEPVSVAVHERRH
jgi:hypothetical protein